MLSDSLIVIWSHLQPILDTLPTNVGNLHLISDESVKILKEFHPNLPNFKWNYMAGHRKGALHGVGASC